MSTPLFGGGRRLPAFAHITRSPDERSMNCRRRPIVSKPRGSGEVVGYGRAPRHGQFQTGRSGNPKGRPKGTLNLATVLERTLRELVVINENGQRKTVTKLEAAIKQLVNRAASGELPALRHLVELARDSEARQN